MNKDLQNSLNTLNKKLADAGIDIQYDLFKTPDSDPNNPYYNMTSKDSNTLVGNIDAFEVAVDGAEDIIKCLTIALETWYPKNEDVIKIVWCTDDVIERARERGVRITKSKARAVLQALKRRHDCNIGITWDVIDYWIDEVKEGRI